MLNKEHFTLIAGKPQTWDEETLRRTQRGKESLVDVQKDQFNRGRRSAKLTQLASGWAVVDNTGLVPPDQARLFNKAKTRAAAIVWGRTWAETDPDNREFFASKTDMEDAG